MNNRSKYDQKAHAGKSSTRPSERKTWKPKRRHDDFGATLDEQYDRWLEKEQQRNRRQHP